MGEKLCFASDYMEGAHPAIMQRLVATINFSDYESRMHFDRILREAGVFERMEQMGVRDGDTVSMYDLMFEYKE